MFLHSMRSEQLATLAGQVTLADEATPELFSEIVAKTARRLTLRDMDLRDIRILPVAPFVRGA